MRPSTLLCCAAVLACALAAAPAHLSPVVSVAPAGAIHALPAGRMLVFVQPAKGTKPVDLDPGFVAGGFTIAGFEMAPAGGAVVVPGSADAYPRALSQLAPGTYDMQALLDVRHRYSYDGIDDGDLTGPVQRVRVGPGTHVTLLLNRRITVPPPHDTNVLKYVDIVSPRLSKFYGRPWHLHASVMLPIGYDPRKKYPAVYWQNGFGGSYERTDFLRERTTMAHDGLHAILVVSDSSCPTGIAQFADSANNGPWGQAFTKELIPAIEHRFAVDARPSHRFLWGHSSGGWAALWLQVTYPDFFGGEWSGSPDPPDFHDFTGPDLLSSPPDNAYVDRYGRPWQLVRIGTRNVMTLRDFVLSSIAEGYKESQFGSFDAVFGPRGSDGEPVALFDKTSGKVNESVVRYWEAHYDIASLIERNYVHLAPALGRKLHVIVGTLDTFHLERGVLRLDARLRRLGMVPDITYVPGASHGGYYGAKYHELGYHWAFRGMAAQLAAYP